MMLLSAVLGLASLAVAVVPTFESRIPLHVRDTGDRFNFTGASGNRYFVIIRSQSNFDPSPYTPTEGQDAWNNTLNEIVQNLDTNDFLTDTALDNGESITTRGSMLDGEGNWDEIGDASEWGSIITALAQRHAEEADPQYLYVTLSQQAGVEGFFAQIFFQWLEN